MADSGSTGDGGVTGDAGGDAGGTGEDASRPDAMTPMEFVSAEDPGQTSRAPADAGASVPLRDSAGAPTVRTVAEGDLYRVLETGLLLNLNPTRGLQVIDLRDASKPAVVGRLREVGTPVEMYVVGARAILLLNNSNGYSGQRDSIAVARRAGGLLLHVDLTNPAQPVVIDREFVPGSIRSSQLVRGADKVALYVAAEVSGCWGQSAPSVDCSGTILKSFDASGADLLERSSINLGSEVRTVKATPGTMIVASYNQHRTGMETQVSLVDIDDAGGRIEQGPSTNVQGYAGSDYDLDLTDDVLRVVSGFDESHLTTHDARVPGQLTKVGDCPLETGLHLSSALFTRNSAFLMMIGFPSEKSTHVFSLDAAGNCAKQSQFAISVSDGMLKPVFEARRLIAIGTDPAQGARKVAVSLYDTTALSNPNPLITRQVVESLHSYPTVGWDAEAYSVIEGGTSLPSTSDPSVIETGLVLVPFVRYDDAQNAQASVQIFTFSEQTLTRRGVMVHESMADRSLALTAELTVNLSGTGLSVFDTKVLDAPIERGRVALAPSYSAVHEFGTHLVRIRDTRGAYRGWWSSTTPPTAYAEVIAAQGDPDTAPTLASIPIPAGSRTFKVGSSLVVVTTLNLCGAGPKCSNESTLRVYDLTDPLTPKQVSSLTSDRLLPGFGYGWIDDFSGVTAGVRRSPQGYDDYSRVLANAIVFGRNIPEKSLGQVERYWTSLELDVLDLTTPSAPKLTPVTFAKDEELVGLIGTNDSVYAAFKKPFEVVGDTRAHAKFYFRQVDLRSPSSPVVGNPIHVPGELVGVEGDQLITRDQRWEAQSIDTWIHSARRTGDVISIVASKQFASRAVVNVLLDGAGHVLVSHDSLGDDTSDRELDKLSIFRTADLAPLSEVTIDRWSKLTASARGKAWFSTEGGFVIVSTVNGATPYAQVFFPHTRYIEKPTFLGDTLLLASGPYGLRALDATANNLLAQ